jgi:DNA-binding transcriptional LysR family regulator
LNVPPAFSRHHVLPFLGDFLERYPQIRVELNLEEARVDLINAGIDLAIRIGVLADSNLKARKIAEEQLWLCISPAFALAHNPPSCPSQLGDYPAILGTQQADGVTLISANEQVKVSLGGSLCINDLDAQLLAVERGLGLGLLPNWLVAERLREGRLVRWLPSWRVALSQTTSALWFIYPPKRIVSSKVRCFIDFMLERIGDPPYWQR